MIRAAILALALPAIAHAQIGPAPAPVAVLTITNATNGHTTQTMTDGATQDRGIANRPGNISYVDVTPGATVAVPAGTQLVRFLGTSTVATQTLQLPASPQDGDQVNVSTGTGLTISNLTATLASGQTVITGVMLRPLTQLIMLFDAGAGTWSPRLMPATLYNDAQAVAAGQAAGFVTAAQVPAGATGAQGPQGIPGNSITGATGPQGPAGVVSTYGASGLIAGYKCVQANATTVTGGTWTLAFNTATFPGFAGFTAVPNVQVQAISASNLLAGLYFATSTAPATTGVAGAVDLAGIGGLGPAGVVVQVRACGS